MSKSADHLRRTQPSRRELRDGITMKEYARDIREGIQTWADYLIETGRIYQ